MNKFQAPEDFMHGGNRTLPDAILELDGQKTSSRIPDFRTSLWNKQFRFSEQTYKITKVPAVADLN
jgi:hypothetical protein